MNTPLLHSKLVVPPLRPDLVTRARLLDKLEANEVTKVLLVSAPAGFGKTTLVSEWLQRSGITAAWLSLDADDNDLRRLLSHLFTAIHAAVPSLGEAELELLQSAKSVEADSLLAPLLNRAAHLTTPLCIVLDDYHLITLREVHEAFDFLLEYAPPTVKLCIVTRADPPLKLAKLRARAQLAELRSDDLRFTPPETSAFLGSEDVALSESDARALTDRAEGWAVGLQVMALSLSGREDSGDFIGELTSNNRFLLDYLLDEVLGRQPEHVQTFLLKTSVLDKLSPALCEALLDAGDTPTSSVEMIETLERANLFLRPLDASRTWFRYHQLFKDVLYHHLKTLHPASIAPLRRSAADWLNANGHTLDALEQLLAGALFAEAADLLAEVAPDLLWKRGDAATLEAWLSYLPAQTLGTRPDLLILRAWAAHMLGDTGRIVPLLDEAELLVELLDAANAESLRAESTALRSFVARMNGEFEVALELSNAALNALPEDAYGLLSLVNGNLGEVYYLRGELDLGHDYHKEESRLAEKEGAVLPSRFALWRISDIQTLRGELEAAKRTSHTMLTMNKIRSVDALGFADVQLGVIALEQNDLAEAERRLSAGIEMGKRLGNPRVFMPGYGPLAKTLVALDRADEAQEVLNDGAELSVQHGVSETWGVPLLGAWQAYLDLKADDLDKAFTWVEQSGLSDPSADVAFTRSFDALIAARVLLAKNWAEDALALLELPSVKLARAVEVDVLKSLALTSLNKKEEALNVLERAVAAASENMHVYTFLDEGASMRDLLKALKDAGRQVAYCSTLLTAFPEAGEKEAVAPASVEGLEDFSERELSVVRLMAGRLSNKEIARELDLSTNTVKWYAKGIFEKLNVHGRLKAASKARELGLI